MTKPIKDNLRQYLPRKFAEKMPGIEKGTITAFLYLLNPQPPEGYDYKGRSFNGEELFHDGESGYFFPKRIYREGEIIYIREEWAIEYDEAGEPRYAYKAGWPKGKPAQWRGASYMPIEAARFFLQAESTTICRIGEIAQEDAKALGAGGGRSWKKKLQEMWDGDLKKSEEAAFFHRNPWVQVVRFQRVERPEGIPEGINERILAHGSDYKSYIIRLAETGEVLASGTAKECAQAMGYQNIRRIYTLINHVTTGRNRKYTVEITSKPRTPRPKGWLRGE
mgnify:CR=1 FL=1